MVSSCIWDGSEFPSSIPLVSGADGAPRKEKLKMAYPVCKKKAKICLWGADVDPLGV